MWRELTEDDVLAALNAPETAAYQSAAIASGQDVLFDILTQVTAECRAHIGDCERNTLAPGRTLPDRVVYHAVALIRYRMMTRLDMEVSEDRRREQRDAVEFFRRVSECKVAIEAADAEEDSTESFASPKPGISARPRQFSRDQQAGI